MKTPHQPGNPRPTPTAVCRTLAPLLPLLESGDLSGAEAATVRRHVAECAWCQNQLAAYDQVDAALRRQFRSSAAETAIVPFSSRENIMSIGNPNATTQPLDLPNPPNAQPPRRKPRRAVSGIAALAAVLLIALLAGTIFALHTAANNVGQRPTTTATHAPTAPATAPATSPATIPATTTATPTPSGVSGRGAPIVANSDVYVGSSHGYLYAFKASDGTQLWRYGAGSTIEGPAVANGVVYFSYDTGGSSGVSPTNGPYRLVALNASTGTQIWSVTGGGAPPLVVNNAVYVGDYTNGTVTAYSTRDGSQLWQIGTGGCDSAPIASDGTALYVNTIACAGVLALRLSDGKTVWHNLSIAGGEAPVILNGIVYVGFCALRETDGTRLWCAKGPNDSDNMSMSVDVVANGTVYTTTMQQTLYAMSQATGQMLWHVGLQHSPLLVGADTVDGLLYVIGGDGKDSYLHALRMRDGAQAWQAQVYPAGASEVVNGVIYVNSARYGLMALRTADGGVIWQKTLS